MGTCIEYYEFWLITATYNLKINMNYIIRWFNVESVIALCLNKDKNRFHIKDTNDKFLLILDTRLYFAMFGVL